MYVSRATAGRPLWSPLDDAEAVIGAGNVRARVPRAHVLEVLAPQPQAAGRGHAGAGRPLPAEVHVRGERVVEALEQVDLALDAALIQGAPALRVVHGDGHGDVAPGESAATWANIRVW